METYGELVDFLRDPKPEVRQQAAQLVLGLTKATDAVAYFRRRESNAIRYLKALCLDDPVRFFAHIFINDR